MRTLFEVLGVEPRFHLAPDELETKFKALSRELHPDRFAKAPAAERVVALRRSTELNDAYRRLKVPARRAEYLLSLAGIDITEEATSSTSKRVPVPPALLMELLEQREELAEAKAANDRARVATLATAARARRVGVMAIVDREFSKYEAGDHSDDVLETLARALIELRYCDKFLVEVDTFEEGAES